MGAAPPPSAFSAPPSSSVSADPAPSSYASADYSKYASKVYESDGTRDSEYAASSGTMMHPRMNRCLMTMQTGAQMGGLVGAASGVLLGAMIVVQERTPRSLLQIPITMVGGGFTFGFFLACGSIIRCEESQRTSSRCEESESSSSQRA